VNIKKTKTKAKCRIAAALKLKEKGGFFTSYILKPHICSCHPWLFS
jgi:hypothetical protein